MVTKVMKNTPKQLLFIASLLLSCSSLHAQRLLTDMMDTSTDMGKSMLSIYEKYNQLRFTIYIQPQWQWTESKGAKSFNGGDFNTNSNNRFMIRRGRFRMDYVRRDATGFPSVQLLFQFDATERGVFVRDMWGRIFENRFHLLSVTTGIFARPFGYELPLGSADRESPERGRMSQTLMKTERDLGAMLSIEPRGTSVIAKRLSVLRFDLGLFNGPGLTSTADYDGHKDLITRLACKRWDIPKLNWQLSGGLSAYYGGIVSATPIIYEQEEIGGMPTMKHDSLTSNIGRLTPRKYYGADMQLKIPNRKGFTELRGEYIRGTQTGTPGNSETPSINTQPLTIRYFDGAYFYFLQHLGSMKHQLVIKYDWYDPNTNVNGSAVDPQPGFNANDIKYSTLGGGYIWYVNPNLKITLWYEHPLNESTNVSGYTEDLKDDGFTCRFQYRF